MLGHERRVGITALLLILAALKEGKKGPIPYAKWPPPRKSGPPKTKIGTSSLFSSTSRETKVRSNQKTPKDRFKAASTNLKERESDYYSTDLMAS